MSTQIAVRLPDDVVDFIDAEVRSGVAPSRAAVVARAVEREHRRAVAERDAAVYAHADDDEFAGLAEYSARVPLDDLD